MYAVNSLYTAVSGFVVDGANGLLFPNGYIKAEHFPSAIATHPSGEYLIVASQSTSKLLVFRVNKINGKLTLLDEMVTKSGVMSPFSIRFHPAGHFVYIAGRMSMNVTGFRFDPQTGKLTPIPGMPVAAGNRPRQLAISPDGRFLYAVNVYSHDVSGYKIDQTTGELSNMPGSPFPTSEAPIVMLYSLMDTDLELGAAPHNITFHPSGKFVFLANWMSSSISSYAVNNETGALSLLKSSPTLTEPHPYDLIVDPGGEFLYTANWVVNKLTAFRINQTTGDLNKIEDISLSEFGFGPVQLWFNHSGTQLYVACYNSHSIEVYDKDLKTGRLTFKGLSSVVLGPRDFDVVLGERPVEFSSRFSFGISEFKKSVFSLKFNQANGNLKPINNLIIDSNPISLALDNANNLLYVVGVKPDILYVFPFNELTGELIKSKEQKLELKETPTHVSVDVNGRFIYISSGNSNRMSIFHFQNETGAVAEWPESPRSTGSNASIVESDPVGRFALLINKDDQTVYPFRYGQILGPATTDITPADKKAVTGKKPSALTFDPFGSYAYISNSMSNNISAYWINRQSGELKELKKSPFKTAKHPIDVEIHPSGMFAFVLSAGKETITTFKVDRIRGDLNPTQHKVSTDSLPRNMVIDAAGRRLYVVYNDRKSVSQFIIDANTGQLIKQSDIKLDFTISELVVDTKIQ